MRIYTKFISILLVLLLFGVVLVAPAAAATFTASDEASLVQAINSANVTPELDIITLTADINLNTTTPYVYNGNNGLPVITAPLVIHGNGHTIRRTSATQFRLLAANSTQLWLKNLTLAGGNAGTSYGGALYVDSTSMTPALTLLDVTIGGSEQNANVARSAGGGIFVRGYVTILDSTISYNRTDTPSSSYRGGGGIYFNSPSAVILNTEISHNSTSTDGGGIAGLYSNMTIIDSLISNNTAFQGGGL
jgi:hypothetical protein